MVDDETLVGGDVSPFQGLVFGGVVIPGLRCIVDAALPWAVMCCPVGAGGWWWLGLRGLRPRRSCHWEAWVSGIGLMCLMGLMLEGL